MLGLVAGPAMADSGGLSAYLRARAADADGHAMRAAGDYAQALSAAPANPLVAIRAFREALVAGDTPLALRALAVLDRAKVAPADGALLPIAVAARADDAVAAEAAIAKLAGTPLAALAPALRLWAAFARTGAVPPVPPAKDAVTRRFAAEAHALLTIASGRAADGVAEIAALGGAQAPLDLRIAAAQLLAHADHADMAQTLLPGLRPDPAAPTLGFGVSRLFVRIASDLAAAPTPSPLTITLVRAALIADPSSDRARLLLAAALDQAGAKPRALAALDGIAPGSAFAVDAAATRVAILATDQPDAAIAAARTLAERTEAGPADWQRYADLLMNADRPADAAPFYARIVAKDAGGWTGWLQYGAALDQAGQWRAAEPVLVKAVALAPDQPLALNYLGYARIEHRTQVPAATAMLARAAQLKPDDASITDSLGWAYYRGGDAARALPLLERAAAGQPANAEIGEHLGDTYWTLGRRFEARYAWRAAALTAPADVTPRIAAKIADGLPPHR
ncbi:MULTISPECIES: hypothetical protein [unclassified Sphingomonas]|uniref:tetratricopeptide repeat protein n=1 Tax=unclassified Sphingomonas TaxID=196159 RepID=UPI00226A8BCC|nr:MULTISPECIES: hypothetical protein [unclassified Sphingomonas]